MIKVYGIPTCGTVRGARKFFKEKNIEVEFINLKKGLVETEKVDYWISKVGIDILFNNRGTKYRTLKLKELSLDELGKREWLHKENMLFKRPIVEYGNEIVVGFDEDKYRTLFV